MEGNRITAAMIAPCGLDCALCGRALQEKDPCPGCRGPNENKPVFCSEQCGIVLCEKRVGNGYGYCDECPDHPCADVTEKETRYTSKYPMFESPAQNLKDIRADGMENFLEKERERWTCGACGHIVCVHTGVCSGCGKRYGAQVVPIDGDTWRIENGEVRCFLLRGTKKALLIDTGMTIRHVRQIAEALAALPVELLNTHSDGDHTGCNGQFEYFYMHPADEPRYRSAGKGGTLIPLKDGDEIDLGNRKLRIVHLPGHTPGSVAVLDVGRRVLLSGDILQEHGHIFMFGEHRNMRDYAESLAKLEKMTAYLDEIWPSHGDIPIDPGCIRKHREAAEKILNKEAVGTPAEVFGQKVTVYRFGDTAFLCGE